MIAASWLILSRFSHCVRQVAADHLGRHNLAFGTLTSNVKTPNRLNYTGNVVISAPTHASLAPYLTGGVGSQTVFESAELGINNTQTFLTGNAGAGSKWYAASGRWGIRAD